MANGVSVPTWWMTGKSVRGASHVKSNLPNQDAVLTDAAAGGSAPIVATVADGHGSAKSFRSQIGSAFAAEVAVKVGLEFVEAHRSSTPSIVKSAAEQQLPSRIVSLWREAVSRHFEENPFSDEELGRVERDAGPAARTALSSENGFFVAYGTTLLAAMIADFFIVYLQLGDGDMLVLPDMAEDAVRPITRDENLIANETTSLCMDVQTAVNEMRVRFQFIGGRAPVLILLSTDGYANAFQSDADFMRVAPDLLGILQASGTEAVERDLPSWLGDASQLGSGDDVTLSIICRSDVLPEHPLTGKQAAPALSPPAEGKVSNE
jgi:serine/threonine protein phosphatase PrpC